MMLRAGQQIGSYRIIDELAHGAYAYVYRATHVIITNRTVVLKLLHTPFPEMGHGGDYFFEEALLLERLRHPHILAILDANLHGNFPYIIKEYAAHGSLREHLRRYQSQPLPLSDALSIIQQIGSALQFTHDRNVVHSDIKPENILFNEYGQALLSDFDISQTFEPAEGLADAVGGTPSYMAPEHFQGIIGPASDQYSLGCIAYELITGMRPFISRDPDVLLQKHMYEEPVLPSHYVPDLPIEIEQAIMQALAKDYEDRHPNVAAFVQILSAVQNTGSLSHSPSSALYNDEPLILRGEQGGARRKKKSIHEEKTMALVQTDGLLPKPVRQHVDIVDHMNMHETAPEPKLATRFLKKPPAQPISGRPRADVLEPPGARRRARSTSAGDLEDQKPVQPQPPVRSVRDEIDEDQPVRRRRAHTTEEEPEPHILPKASRVQRKLEVDDAPPVRRRRVHTPVEEPEPQPRAQRLQKVHKEHKDEIDDDQPVRRRRPQTSEHPVVARHDTEPPVVRRRRPENHNA